MRQKVTSCPGGASKGFVASFWTQQGALARCPKLSRQRVQVRMTGVGKWQALNTPELDQTSIICDGARCCGARVAKSLSTIDVAVSSP